MSIKDRLREQKREREAAAEAAHADSVSQEAQEETSIQEAMIAIDTALKGYKRERGKDHWGHHFKITIPRGKGMTTETLYVVVKYENHTYRPADDCDEITTRSLGVSIGRIINEPEVTTNLEGFENAFIGVLKRHRLDEVGL